MSGRRCRSKARGPGTSRGWSIAAGCCSTSSTWSCTSSIPKQGSTISSSACGATPRACPCPRSEPAPDAAYNLSPSRRLVSSVLLDVLGEALADAARQNGWEPPTGGARVPLTVPSDPTHGDLASNLALLLSKSVKKPPREVAQKL